MDFIKFLISKSFLKNVLVAIVILLLIVFGLKVYLGSYTNHGEYHLVPDLQKKSFDEAKKILTERKMNIVVIDTMEYNPKYPAFSIVEQNPHKNDKVKVGRKIYVKLNSGKYAEVSLPDIFGKTKRQALTLLKSSGFVPGKISTKPYFAEIVLYAMYKNDTLKKTSKIPKTATIDLIIGDGNRPVPSGDEEGEETGKVDNNIQNTLDNVLGN